MPQPRPLADVAHVGTPGASPWREPMVWLVISGPLAVMLAGAVTVALTLRYPDPPLVLTPPAAVAPAAPVSATPGNAAQDAARLPAQQARNHAATGGR
jgi:uncharacterized protein